MPRQGRHDRFEQLYIAKLDGEPHRRYAARMPRQQVSVAGGSVATASPIGLDSVRLRRDAPGLVMDLAEPPGTAAEPPVAD